MDERQTYKLVAIPPPHQYLTPEAALQWLEEDAPCWVSAIEISFEVPDEKRAYRRAFQWLVIDLGVMLAACAKALSTGKTVRVQREPWALEAPDARDRLKDLARIVAAEAHSPHAGGPYKWAFGEIGTELVRRLQDGVGQEDA